MPIEVCSTLCVTFHTSDDELRKVFIVHLGKYGVFPLVIHVCYHMDIDTCASLGADIKSHMPADAVS
jgi:hypothetical protein